jgi:hypothetical protein
VAAWAAVPLAEPVYRPGCAGALQGVKSCFVGCAREAALEMVFSLL